MTERGRQRLHTTPSELGIGPSVLHWQHDRLDVELDEIAVPWPTRLRGRLRLMPQVWLEQQHALDAAGCHLWRPIAPRARIEVDLPRPGLRFSGEAYLDSNFGSVALERDFERWHWSRASLPGDRSVVLYDVDRRDGSHHSLALQFDGGGDMHACEAPAAVKLPATAWRLARSTRSDGGARVQRTLEDGPFYARSLLQSHWRGEAVTAMHESLCLRRFTSPWVQAMLPFRMPRCSG